MKYYTIEELTKLTGFTYAQLYHLKVKPAYHDSVQGARAYYDQATIDKLKELKHLKEISISPSEIEKKYQIYGSSVYRWIKDGSVTISKVNGKQVFLPEDMPKLKEMIRKYKNHQNLNKEKTKHNVHRLANQYNMPFVNIKQILYKLDLSPEDLNDPENKKKFEDLVPNIKSKKPLRHFPHKNINKTELPKDQRYYLQRVSNDLDIPYETLSRWCYRHFILSFQDQTDRRNRTYIDKETYDWLAKNYLNYPDEPLFTINDAIPMVGLSNSRIHTILKAKMEKMTKILGDKNRYLTQRQLDKLPLWNQEVRNIIHAPTKKLVTNTKKKYLPKQHTNVQQLSTILQTSQHIIYNWARSQRVDYYYNGHDPLFFDDIQVQKIKHQYLNYPEKNMVPEKEVTATVKALTDRITRATICIHLNIDGHKILGDNRKLYTQAEVDHIIRYAKQY